MSVRFSTGLSSTSVSYTHLPQIPMNNKILLAEFGLHRDGEHARNCVIFGACNVDRSPCGTGTCAKMALLADRGDLAPNEPFLHESILGTLFEGRYEEGPMIGDYHSIIPFIKGSANIVGFNWLISHENDPLLPGFLLH